MSLVNDEFPSFKCQDALDDSGYVLTFDTVNGGVKKAASGDVVLGIAATGTLDMFGNAVAGEEVAVIPAGRALIVDLQLAPDNQAVSYGAPLCIDSVTAGTVDFADGVNETGATIAYALEDKAANSGGKIKALLL